jgi:hypothetical protein
MKTKSIRMLVTVDGLRYQVPGTKGWTATARLEVVRCEINRTLSGVQFAPTGLAHAGRLKLIAGRPDVMVRANGGLVDREHRVSIHVVSSHHEAMLRHMEDGGRVFQLAVAAVDPQPRGRATLAIACFDYGLIASEVSRAFARRSIWRLNLTIAARREGAAVTLRIPELGMPVPSGVGEIVGVLHHAAGTDASAALTTEDRVAIVAAVMERRMGLQTSVATQDARTKVAHDRLRHVGLPEVPPHGLLGREVPCARADVHTLARTDLIGAPETRELLSRPAQELVLVEVENKTSDGVEKLKDRMDAALALGLRPARCIAVVRDEEAEWFRRRLARASAVVRSLTSVEPMSKWYAEYCELRDEYVAAQRAMVRRAVA